MRPKAQERSILNSANVGSVDEQKSSGRAWSVSDKNQSDDGRDVDGRDLYAKDRAQDEQQEEVRKRAYEIYVQRGRGEGQDLEDWLQAEAEVFETQRGKRQAA